MGFLAALVAKLIEWFLVKLGLVIAKEVKQVQADHEAEKQAEADKQVLIGAKSDEDKEAAAKSIINHTFN